MAALVIQRGQSVKWRICLKQDDGSPLNITGGTWEVLAQSLGEGVNPACAVTNGATGESEVTIAATMTENIKIGARRIRLRINLVGGDALAIPPLDVMVQ